MTQPKTIPKPSQDPVAPLAESLDLDDLFDQDGFIKGSPEACE